MDTLNIIFQVLSNPVAILVAIFFFGASIFIHEYGHYLAARWRGLKIERFSIGMGPRLFGWKDRHGVDWQVAALPIGGYVLLPQLAEMKGLEGSSEHTAEDLPPLSWTDKVTVAVAGAVFNVLFALALGSVLWVRGLPQPAELATTRIGAVAEEVYNADDEIVPGPAAEAGLRRGDRILAVDGKRVDDFFDLQNTVLVSDGLSADGRAQVTLTIEREGETQEVVVHPILSGSERLRSLGLYPAREAIIGLTFTHSPAERAGLLPGDRIVALDGTPVVDRGQISEALQADATATYTFTIERPQEDGSTVTLEVPIQAVEARLTADGTVTAAMIGVRWEEGFALRKTNPFTLVGDVVELTYSTLSALVNPRTDVGLRNLSGPVGILNIMRITAEQGLLFLLWIVIIINVNLAVLNLLPLPILDGGHIVLATWHKLVGWPIPPRIVASLQGAMVVFLLGVMLYVTFFDLGRVAEGERDEMEATRTETQYLPEPLFPVPGTPPPNAG